MLLSVGETAHIDTYVTPDNATDKSLSYQIIGNQAVASVDSSGNVRGLKSGSVRVLVTANDGYGHAYVSIEVE